MTKNPPDRVASRLIRHQVRVMRTTARVERRVETEIIGQLEKVMVDELVDSDPTAPKRRGDKINRAGKASHEAAKKSRASMRKAASLVDSEAAEIIAADQLAVARVLTEAGIAVQPAPARVIRDIIADTVLEGATAGEWWADRAEDAQRTFKRQITQGLRDGENLGQLVKRIKGVDARSGVFGLKRKKDAQALVRTSIQSQLNGVRQEMFRRNSDVIRAQQFMTAFDGKVCEQCAAFSGGVFDFDGDPLPESPIQTPLPTLPPLHFQCRCILIAVLDDEPAAEDIGFEDWLRTQDADVQVEVLGQTKRKMWLDGDLSFSQLVDQSGRPMTIEELREAV